jgi:L-arabinose isomerase
MSREPTGRLAGTLPRVAVLHPYWTLWEHTAPAGFRAERLRLARGVAEWLAAGAADAEPAASAGPEPVEVVLVDEVASVEDGERVGAALAADPPDAVLVLQTMAVPPAYALAALARVPGALAVIWALHESGLVGDAFDHGDITTQGATVGAPMLSNVLTREGRAFELVLGRRGDPVVERRVRDAVRAAAAASAIRRARLGRVGEPIPGYLHVDLDEVALAAATGIEVVRIDPDEVVERYRAVDPGRVRALDAEVRAGWAFEGDVDADESLERSLRAALALEDMAVEHRLDAGAFNCHVPQFRFGEEIGIAPCFGLGRLTSMGVPFTCTGDVVTAVAMLTTKRLGGAAMYHEIEAIDYATGEVVIANSGEHDLAWLAPTERPRLRRNGWFCGKDPRCGVCAVLEPPAGPATLVGFTPHPEARGGFRYVVARGELTARRFPVTGTANGAFRFAAGTVEEAWARWAAAGVNHHSSATPGDLSVGVSTVARLLGVEAVVV